MYVCGINHRIMHPSNICVTGIRTKLQLQLQTLHYTKWLNPFISEDYVKLYPKTDLVYLIANSKEMVTSIEEGKVYIIGGIVDRNRHKLIRYNKALSQGIATAGLPIAEYIDVKETKILTFNHTFACIMS